MSSDDVEPETVQATPEVDTLVPADPVPAGPKAKHGAMVKAILALETIALAAMSAALAADVLSRFSDPGSTLPRFGLGATLVAVVAQVLALVLGLISSRGVAPGQGQAFLMDIGSIVLLGLSIAMRLVYWETGMATPFRAMVPLAGALALEGLAAWVEQGPAPAAVVDADPSDGTGPVVDDPLASE